jgi:hypothetical protein
MNAIVNLMREVVNLMNLSSFRRVFRSNGKMTVRQESTQGTHPKDKIVNTMKTHFQPLFNLIQSFLQSLTFFARNRTASTVP